MVPPPEVTAVVLDAPGRPPSLRLGEMAPEPPGPGELSIRVQTCGINPVDWKLAAVGAPPWQWPHVLGLDVVGVVEEAGDRDHEFLVGSQVAVHQDLARQGGLAQMCTVAADMAAVLPDGADPVRAATVPCPGLTAWQAVERTGIKGADRVLIVGAAGAVGTFATQLAAQRLDDVGAVVAVVGPDDLTRVLDLGADESFDYREGPVTQLVGGRFDVILDLVGNDPTVAELLGYGGRLASVARPTFGPVAPFTTAPTLVELALGAVYTDGSHRDRARLANALAELLDRVHRGSLQVPPLTVCAPVEAPDVVRALSEGDVRDKVVVDWR